MQWSFSGRRSLTTNMSVLKEKHVYMTSNSFQFAWASNAVILLRSPLIDYQYFRDEWKLTTNIFVMNEKKGQLIPSARPTIAWLQSFAALHERARAMVYEATIHAMQLLCKRFICSNFLFQSCFFTVALWKCSMWSLLVTQTSRQPVSQDIVNVSHV